MDEETKAVSDAFLKGVNGLLNDLQGPSGYSSNGLNSEVISPLPQANPLANEDASAHFFALRSGDLTVPGVATELSRGELYPRPPLSSFRQETAAAGTYTSPLHDRSTTPQMKVHSPLYAPPPGMSLNQAPTVAKPVEQQASYSTMEMATPEKNAATENGAADRLSARIASTRAHLARGSSTLHGGASGLRSSGSFGSASPGASVDASADALQADSTRPHPPPPPEDEEEDGPPPVPVLSAHTVLSPVPTAPRSQSSQNAEAIAEPSIGFDSPRRGRDRNGPVSISLGSVPVNASGGGSSSSTFDTKRFSRTQAMVSDPKYSGFITTSPEKKPNVQLLDHTMNATTLANAQKLVVFFAAQAGLSSSSSSSRAMMVNDLPPGRSTVSINSRLQSIDWSPSVMAVLKSQVPEVFRPSDAVVCTFDVLAGGQRGSPAHTISAGTVGEFLEFQLAPPFGFARVAFVGNNGRAAVAERAPVVDLVRCLQEFVPGDVVSWIGGFDEGVPRGEVGTVLGQNQRGRIQVRFPKGTWNFLPSELRKERDNGITHGACSLCGDVLIDLLTRVLTAATVLAHPQPLNLATIRTAVMFVFPDHAMPQNEADGSAASSSSASPNSGSSSASGSGVGLATKAVAALNAAVKLLRDAANSQAIASLQTFESASAGKESPSLTTAMERAQLNIDPEQVARAANALVPFTPEGVEKSHSEHDDDDDSLASSSPYRHPLSQEEVASLSSPALPSKRQQVLTETEAVGMAAVLESVLQHLLLNAYSVACRSSPKGGGVISVKHLDLAVRAPASYNPQQQPPSTAAKSHPPEEGDTNLPLLFPRGCSALARSESSGGSSGLSTAAQNYNPAPSSSSQPLQAQDTLEHTVDHNNGNERIEGDSWHEREEAHSPADATIMAVQQAYQNSDINAPVHHQTDDNDDELPLDSSSRSSSTHSSRRAGGNDQGASGSFSGSPVKLTASALAGHNAETTAEAAQAAQTAPQPSPEPVSRLEWDGAYALSDLEARFEEAKAKPKKDYSLLKTLKQDIAQQRALNEVHATLRAKILAAEANEEFTTCEELMAEVVATPRTLLEAVHMAEQAERDMIAQARAEELAQAAAKKAQEQEYLASKKAEAEAVFERKRAAKERAEQVEQKKQAQKLAEAKARREEVAEQKRLKGLEEKRRVQQQIEEADEKKRQREENLKRQAAKRRQQMLLMKQQQELQQLQQEEIAALEEQQQGIHGSFQDEDNNDEDQDASFGARNSASHSSLLQSPPRSHQDSRRSVSPRRNLSSGAASTLEEVNSRSTSPRGRPQSPRRGAGGAGAMSSPNIVSPGRPGGRSTSPRRTLSRSDLSPRRTPSRSDLSSSTINNNTPRSGTASSLYPPKASPYAAIVNSHQDRIDFANEWEHLGEGDALEVWHDNGVSMAEEVAREAEVTAVRLERQKRAAPERKRSLRVGESQETSSKRPSEQAQPQQQQQPQLKAETEDSGLATDAASSQAKVQGGNGTTVTEMHSSSSHDDQTIAQGDNTSDKSSNDGNNFLTSKQQALHALAAQRRRFNDSANAVTPDPAAPDPPITGCEASAVPPATNPGEVKANSADLPVEPALQQNTSAEEQKLSTNNDARNDNVVETTTNPLQEGVSAVAASEVEEQSKCVVRTSNSNISSSNDNESNLNEFMDAQADENGSQSHVLMNENLPPSSAASVATTTPVASTNDDDVDSPSSQLSLAPARAKLPLSREPSSLLSPPREIPSAAAWMVAPTPSSVPLAPSSVADGNASVPSDTSLPAAKNMEGTHPPVLSSPPLSLSTSSSVVLSPEPSSSLGYQQVDSTPGTHATLNAGGLSSVANSLEAQTFTGTQRGQGETPSTFERSSEHAVRVPAPNPTLAVATTTSASSSPPATPPRVTAASASPTNRTAPLAASPPSSPRSLSLRNYASAFRGQKADACEQMWWKFENTAKEFNFLRQFTQDKTSPASSSAAAAASTGSSAPSMQFWLDLQRNANDPLKDAASGLVRRSGVAPSRRRLLWTLWSGGDVLRRSKPADAYRHLAWHSTTLEHGNHDLDHARTIVADVERTCTEVPYFRDGDGASVLVRVLTAFSRLNPELGYVQGMSTLAAFVLITFRGGGDFMSDVTTPTDLEEDAFWTFAAIVSQRCQGYLEKGMTSLMSDTFALSKLVERHCKSSTAVQNLKSIEFDWLFVTPDWFVQLFVDSAPPAVVLHIWDLLLWHPPAETPAVLMWVVLAIIEKTAPILAACSSFQQAIETLRDSLFDLQHVNDLETSSVINHREIMTALPPLRAAHAKEESAKAKKKADRNHKRGQNSESSSSGTPGKGGLFGWFSGSGGKDLIGN